MMNKVLAGLAIGSLLAIPFVGIATTANAAPIETPGSPPENLTWNAQTVLTADGTQQAGTIAFDNTREGYEQAGQDEPAAAGDRYDFLKYEVVSDLFFVEEAHSRVARVTNTTSTPFSVTGISAELIDVDYVGESVTHHADADGTSVLTAPVTDFIVAAGETAYVQFDTVDPVVSTVRTNVAGEITGIGSATRFSFTINGETYWFQEVAGFGSAQSNTFAVPNPQDSAENLFPPCEFGGDGGTTDPELTIGLCSWYSVQSVEFTSSYFVPTAPLPEDENPEIPQEPVIVPVTVSGTVKTADGEPMSGYTVTLRDSAGVETHTDISDANGFWSVSDVFPEHYSAYILVKGEWILILSPEDFDVADEDLTDKDFVLDRDAVEPPVEEPAPDPTPEVPEEETPPVVPPVVIPEPTPEEEVPPVTPAPEPTPEVETPVIEPPVVVTDPPADSTPPVVEIPVVEPDPVGTPATVPPTGLALTGADTALPMNIALSLLTLGALFLLASRKELLAAIAARFVSQPASVETSPLFIFQSKGE